MLAQNFKTPDDLGLRDIDVDALVKVLGMLERGELQHAPTNEPIPNGFNMATISAQHKCGTVCCIAGWASIVRGSLLNPGPPEGRKKNAYRELIMPTGWQTGKHTPEQAAIALRSYLTTGEASWSEAMSA